MLGIAQHMQQEPPQYERKANSGTNPLKRAKSLQHVDVNQKTSQTNFAALCKTRTLLVKTKSTNYGLLLDANLLPQCNPMPLIHQKSLRDIHSLADMLPSSPALPSQPAAQKFQEETREQSSQGELNTPNSPNLLISNSPPSSPSLSPLIHPNSSATTTPKGDITSIENRKLRSSKSSPSLLSKNFSCRKTLFVPEEGETTIPSHQIGVNSPPSCQEDDKENENNGSDMKFKGNREGGKTVFQILGLIASKLYSYSVKRYVDLLFLNRAFGVIFVSYFFSQIGNWFTEVAGIGIIQMVASTYYPQYSGILLVILYISAFAPAIVLMPITGIASDFIDRRKIMLCADFSRIFITASFIIPALYQSRLFFLFYVITFLLFSIKAFYDPARESLFPFILKSKNQYITANALIAVNGMICASIGSSLGGYLMNATRVGVIVNFSVDSITFAVAAIFSLTLFCVKALKKSERGKKEEYDRDGENTQNSNRKELVVKIISKLCFFPILFARYWKEVFKCTKYLIRNPYILSVTLLKGIGALNYGAVEILMIKYATSQFRNIFSGDSTGLTMFGIAKAVYGMTTGLSPFIMERLLPLNTSSWCVRLVIVCNFIGVVGGYIMIYFSSTHFSLFFSGVGIIGCAYGNVWAFSTSLLQYSAEQIYLGRLIALDIGFFLNILQISSYVGTGILIDFLEFDAPMLCFLQICIGLFTFLFAILWFFISLGNRDRDRLQHQKKPKESPENSPGKPSTSTTTKITIGNAEDNEGISNV